MFGEGCDDGIIDGKGCKDDCSGPMPGYLCGGGNANTPMTCQAVCGDGVILSTEACDDGNSFN